MAKYSTTFKLQVVRYQERYGGADRTAARFNLDRGTVRRWFAAYQIHGRSGLDKRYRSYSLSFKIEVLRFLEQQGGSMRQACAHLNIRATSTILTWHRRYESGGIDALTPRSRGRPMSPSKTSKAPIQKSDNEMTAAEMKEELAYLRAENAYLKKLKALAQVKRSGAGKKR